MGKSNFGTYGIIGLFVLVLAAAAFFVITKAPSVTPAQALAPKPADIGMGDPNAPIKMIEYASLDCPHCAEFAIAVLPQIKSAYIDSGKVYYVMRDAPLSDLAALAALMARCDPATFYAFTDTLFSHQEQWLGKDVPDQKEALLKFAHDNGRTDEMMRSCVTQTKLDELIKTQTEAQSTLRVTSVPTIFINNQEFRDERSLAGLEKAFAAILTPPAAPQ